MAHSLKTDYLRLSLGVVLTVSLSLGGLAYYEHQVDTAAVEQLAGTVLTAKLDAALRAEAEAQGTLGALRLGVPLGAGDRDAIRALGDELLARNDVTRVEVLDAAGAVVYDHSRVVSGSAGTEALQLHFPVASGGELRLWLGRHGLAAASADLGGQLARQQTAQHQRLLLAFGCLTLALLSLGMAGAWLIARRLARPLAALVQTAERIGEGDYTTGVGTIREDEIGDLQGALERLRQTLRDTTITRNYLNTVLNSLSDAVLVTSPDGLVKSCNEAAQTLLGYREDELLGQPLLGFVDAAHRDAYSPRAESAEVLETVLHTARGQTIPVSMASSPVTTDDPLFQGHIHVARDITERKRAERRIRYLARYDALTKMPNRMQFQHLLQQAIARSRRNSHAVALLYLDLDRFKEVNDTFGHAAGDRTLEILSERLTRNLNKETVIGRLAGDEFAMFIDELPLDTDNRGTLAALSRTLLDEISRTFYVNNQEVYLTASVGIALCPFDADNVIDLIRNADAAMYHSKQNGGNSAAFYIPEMNAAAVERLMLKAKLRRALERNEFVMLYQSKVDLRDGRVIGAEALLRWRLPGHGDISPAHFIPLAEETSLIMDIGEWVMDRVCADYREWQHSVADPGRISINLSLKQLKQPSFIARARAIFRKHDVSPACFELEVTETTLMTDPKRTIGLLNELYGMGLHLAIDDFGTGYSSLSALQQFPLNTLKIDQSFVRDVASDADDAAIVRTIIEMGKSLELDVVAEGIETTQQLEFLRRHRCDFGQGLLFGPAMAASAWLEILGAQARGAALPHHAILCQPLVRTSAVGA